MLTIHPTIAGNYDLIDTCEGCKAVSLMAANIKPEQLIAVKETRDQLAHSINALAGLSMNCAIPERLRNTISSIAQKLDAHLDKIDGLANA